MKCALYISLATVAGAVGLQFWMDNPADENLPARRLVRQCVTGDSTATHWQMLKALGPEALPFVREALTEKRPIFSQAYAEFRATLPGWAQNRLPGVAPVEMIRANAAVAAGMLGPAGAPLVPELVALLKDDVADANAAWALGQIGPAAEDAIPALVTALQEQRPMAATALGHFGRAATLALPALTEETRGGPCWLRLEARQALKNINGANPNS